MAPIWRRFLTPAAADHTGFRADPWGRARAARRLSRVHLDEQDWRRLEALRGAFLGTLHPDTGRSLGEGADDYWADERDLELYDAFFARRIAWKWAGALGELAARGWRAPRGRLLDFGCGTGAAARAFLETFGDAGVEGLTLVDRSSRARAFAGRALRAEHPGLEVRETDPTALAAQGDVAPSVLIVSHVLNELGHLERGRLLELARHAGCVLWLEPGDRDTSRALSRVHDELLPGARVLAPCPHQGPCGALREPLEWCHHFARAPVDAFTTREWTFFAQRLAIDLRSLPYAWLALERSAAAAEPTPDGAGLARVVGRVRQEKGKLFAHLCDAAGVREVVLLDRDAKALAKLLREPKGRPLLLRGEVRDGRLVSGAAELPPLRGE